MKKYIALLLSLSFLWYMSMGLIAPIYAIFVEDIGGGLFAAGGAYAVYGLAAGVLTIFISRKEDKLNKKRLLFYGHAVAALGIGGYFLVSNVWHLVAVEAVLGIAGAITRPAWKSSYTSVIKGRKSASGWGLWEGSTDIAYALASLAGGAIAALFGFKILFAVMFTIAVLSVIFTIILIKQRRDTKIFG